MSKRKEYDLCIHLDTHFHGRVHVFLHTRFSVHTFSHPNIITILAERTEKEE